MNFSEINSVALVVATVESRGATTRYATVQLNVMSPKKITIEIQQFMMLFGKQIPEKAKTLAQELSETMGLPLATSE